MQRLESNKMSGDRTIFYYETVDSTNTKAKEYAKVDKKQEVVFVAECQTKGRGRNGRKWVSPKAGNLYFSILLRPNIRIQQTPMLTLVMGYAISLAIEKMTGLCTQIKWPNDLVINGKKVCGILTEMRTMENAVDYVVIGAGINVGMESVTQEIEDVATSIKLEGVKEMDTRELLACILQEFEKQYRVFLKDMNLRSICKGYNARLVNIGREILVIDKEKEYVARTDGINDKGELLIERQDGEKEKISSGEVSVRGVCGYV